MDLSTILNVSYAIRLQIPKIVAFVQTITFLHPQIDASNAQFLYLGLLAYAQISFMQAEYVLIVSLPLLKPSVINAINILFPVIVA